MCISFLYLKHFLLVISFNKYKEVPLKLENNIRNFSDLFQVVQFQESNLLNDICHLIVSCCENMVNKVRYEKLLSLYVLGEDLASTKELLHKAQAVKKSKHVATWWELVNAWCPPRTPSGIHVEVLHWPFCQNTSFPWVLLENTWQHEGSCMVNLSTTTEVLAKVLQIWVWRSWRLWSQFVDWNQFEQKW